MSEVRAERFAEVGNLQNSIVGDDLVSGDLTLVPTHKIHRVTGTAAVTGITPPGDGFAGEIILLPVGVFTWTTATNIALAGTAVVGKALHMTYNPRLAKWYPSYVA